MAKHKRLGASLFVAGAVALGSGVTALPASADAQPQSHDVVGVGSDTLQYTEFLWDGDPQGDPGFNNGQRNRVFAFYATGDDNGRAVFDGTCGAVGSNGLGTPCQSSTNQVANSLAGTVTLRAGTLPVVRPNGSGAGVGALIANSTGGSGYHGLPAGEIDFARMSRLPNTTEESTCDGLPACGALHVIQLGTDTLSIATSKNVQTNAPASLTAVQLVHIYQCDTGFTKWSDTGVGGTSSNTIHPLIPQTGSGTRNFFLADLQAANGGTAITLGACVRTVQEHDPTGIFGDPSPADAIEPFSAARLSLLNTPITSGGPTFFGNTGASSGAAPAFAPNQLTTLSGTGTYSSVHGIYIAIRKADEASTTPFEPGSTLNWAQTLFIGANSWVARASSKSLIAAAGFTPAYADCGYDPTSAANCQ